MAKAATAPSPLPEKIGNLLQESRWLGVGAVALFLILALWGFDKEDPGWSHAVVSSSLHNPTGRAGAWIADLMLYVFGLSAWWWVVLLGMFVWWGVRKFNAPEAHRQHPLLIALGGFLFLLLASCSLEALRFYSMQAELPLAPGGMLGIELGGVLAKQLGYTGSTLFLLAAMAVGWSIFSGMSWLWAFEKLGLILEAFVGFFYGRVDAWRDRQIGKEVAQQREVVVEEEKRRVELHEPIVIETPPPEVPVSKKAEARLEREKQQMLFPEAIVGGQLPPLHLLDPAPPATETVGADTLEYTSRLIERKLADFGVQVKVLAAMPGPVITRYEIEPAVGVKGAQIVNLARDLARALAMVSIRVVETVPGKSCMALELPNPKRQMVKLSEIIASKPYNDMSSPLTVCLGKDIGGQPVVADLAKTPHLLVAGTTGSGKSVGVNAMILSMLYKSEPEHVRLIMVDPKMLELSIYEGIPHLLAPVVTDMKQAANALHWCVTEMEKRYKLMSAMGVRNIAGLNTKIKDAEKKGEHIPNPLSLTPETPEPLKAMPYIVVIIDELADLMMVVGKKVEEQIARLAQKARAAGIHLVLATQRPSVDVITGLIKANIPTRIAFQVSSKIDSRTILDQGGAESLLGMGDMLYMPAGTSNPTRVHGAFVDDHEVHKVVADWKLRGEPDYIDEILSGESDGEGGGGDFGGGGDEELDPLFDEAVAFVVESRRGSTSSVQRKFKIGYNRAARLIEQMENQGIVSAPGGNGQRDVLAPPPVRD